GGSPFVALAGKLAPLFVIFSGIMFLVPLILEGFLGISFKGHVPMVLAGVSLLIIASMALGALLQLLARDLATGLSATGLILSPAFGFLGVGFPILGMNTFAQAWGVILPVRWYMAVLFGQAAHGLSVPDSAGPFAALAALAALYSLLAILCLRAFGPGLAERPAIAEPMSAMQAQTATRGIGGAFAAEWRRVLATPGAFGLLILAPLV